MWVTSSPETALTPTAIALGNFDGVHLGHQQVVQPVLNKSDISQPLTVVPNPVETSCFAANSLSEPEVIGHTYATVVTFNPHPQEFFSGQPRKLLTPSQEKINRLQSLGVEQLVLLPFDHKLACLSPEEFVERILVQQLKARSISVGKDFRFGLGRKGTAAQLQAIAANYGITVTIVPLQTCAGERISSSSIREALQLGDLQTANRLLSHPYSLTGLVVSGQQLGRTLGFPTANLQLPSEKFLPRYGVYCVRVAIEPPQPDSKSVDAFTIPGVINIGCRPTVDGTNPTVEVHLLDWTGDLYGKTLTVSLEEFLRPEQKFSSLDALKAQIESDCDRARKTLMG